MSKTLGFASGVMITISLIDLIPNSFLIINKEYNKTYTIFLILIGFIVGIMISNIINQKVEKNAKNSLKLYKLGIINMILLILHNIPEGIVTYITTTNNLKLGITIALAIAFHNIPEGISISIPIYYSTNSKLKSLFYTLVSGISEPFGAIISYLFLSKYINNMALGLIYSIVAGMMINLSTSELYNEAINYNKNNAKKYFFLGLAIMLLNHIIFN